MSADSDWTATFTFGDFRLECGMRRLRRRGRNVLLPQRPFDCLSALVAAEGRVLTIDQLRRAMWPVDAVVDANIEVRSAIRELRQVLGDRQASPQFIEEIDHSGHRFVAPVTRVPDPLAHCETVRPVADCVNEWQPRTGAAVIGAIQGLEHAVQQTPQSAPSWARLAEASLLAALYGLQPAHRAMPHAKTAAERALQIDDRLTLAHLVLAATYKFYDWNWTAAEQSYHRAIAIDPAVPHVRRWYAHLLARLGRYDEALAQLDAARKAGRVSATIDAGTSEVWLDAGEPTRALASAQAAISNDRRSAAAHLALGRAYVQSRDLRRATVALTAAARLGDHAPHIDANLAYAWARLGAPAQAEPVLARLLDCAEQRVAVPVEAALACIGLGTRQVALKWLERGWVDRSPRLLAINDPFFSDLRSEPGFGNLLARVGLHTH